MIHFHLTPTPDVPICPSVDNCFFNYYNVSVMHNCTMDFRRHWCVLSASSGTFLYKAFLNVRLNICKVFYCRCVVCWKLLMKETYCCRQEDGGLSTDNVSQRLIDPQEMSCKAKHHGNGRNNYLCGVRQRWMSASSIKQLSPRITVLTLSHIRNICNKRL